MDIPCENKKCDNFEPVKSNFCTQCGESMDSPNREEARAAQEWDRILKKLRKPV